MLRCAPRMGLIQDTIIAEIVTEFEKAKRRGLTDQQSYSEAAERVGVMPADVRHHVTALRSTVKLAQMKIRAKASVMVDRIVEKAPTSELIDILSRPNVGVLEPSQKGGQGGGGFILSVGLDSLGGVRATAALLPESPAGLPAPQESHRDGENIIDVGGIVDGQEDGDAPERPNTADAFRKRLALARATAPEPESLDTPADSPSPEPEEGPRPKSRTPWLENGDSGHV